MDLGGDMKRWGDKVLTEVTIFHAETADRFFSGTIRDTPVDTGLLKGNWVPSRGKLPKFKALKGFDKTGSRRLARVQNVIVSMFGSEANKRKSQSLYLTNSLHYAIRAESRGWGDLGGPGPYGMVRGNFHKTKNMIRARRLG